MSDDDFIVAREGEILVATFNRPTARNALTFAMYDALAALCRGLAGEASLKALILTGAGTDAFAAGTDIAQFRTFATDADALAYEARIERALQALEACPVPTIAAIAGACTGGGAAIAGCCDVRIGAENLRFGFPIARTLGNCLSAENLARLVSLLGEARVKDLLMTARLYDSAEALGSGLVRSVVAPADLGAAARDLAQTIAGLAPLTLRSTKLALTRLRPPATAADDLLLMCYRSADFREGVHAFSEKRRPVWTGR